MMRFLSYPIRVGDPGWPENPTLSLEQFTSIDHGEVANTYRLHLFNHFGSHMDGPNHFNAKGIQLWQVPVEKFVYDRVLLLDVELKKEQLLMVEDILPHKEAVCQADLILFRSHFSGYRTSDSTSYSFHGPGISAELSKYFIEQCPNLKAIGMDWISLASYAHPNDGFLAHQYLLGMYHNRYILIIEDLNLEDVHSADLQSVMAFPIRVQDVDSGPCTVVAFNQHLVV